MGGATLSERLGEGYGSTPASMPLGSSDGHHWGDPGLGRPQPQSLQFHPAHQALPLLLPRGEPRGDLLNRTFPPGVSGWLLPQVSLSPSSLSTLFPHQVQVYDLTQYEHCPDDVLVLGTDGLWDVTSDCEVAATVDRVLSTFEPNDPSR